MSDDYIVKRAVTILRKAADTIEERDKSYNSNGISYEDYMIRGVDSGVEQVLECFVRLWNQGHEDKAFDMTAYTALLAASIESGVPQSRFSPLFHFFMPQLYKAMKEHDTRTGERIDGDYVQRAV